MEVPLPPSLHPLLQPTFLSFFPCSFTQKYSLRHGESFNSKRCFFVPKKPPRVKKQPKKNVISFPSRRNFYGRDIYVPATVDLKTKPHAGNISEFTPDKSISCTFHDLQPFFPLFFWRISSDSQRPPFREYTTPLRYFICVYAAVSCGRQVTNISTSQLRNPFAPAVGFFLHFR